MLMEKNNRSLATRRALTKAALHLFAEKPYAEVSLLEITERAGQKNRNALQYHFGSKRALFEQILLSHADEIDTLRQQLIDALPKQNTVSVEVAIDIYLEPFLQYTRRSENGRLYAKFLAHFLRTPERVEKVLNPDIPMSTPPSSLAEVLVSISPTLTPEERDQLLFMSNAMMIYSLDNLVRAEEQNILALDSPMGRHILRTLHTSLVSLWTL
jgi:AcrR family transcriptional regulator